MFIRKNFLYSLLILALFSSLQIGEAIAENFSPTEIQKEFVFNEGNLGKFIEFFGKTAQEQFGSKIVSGDLNADNIDDLIISSPFYSSGLEEWNGKISVFFGGNSDLDNPDIVFFGVKSGNQLGMSMDIADLNGDNIDDLIMGEYNSFSNDIRPGRVYIYYGNNDSIKKSIFLDDDFNGTILEGESDKDGFGLKVLATDLDMNGINELLVSSPFADKDDVENVGKIYLYANSDFSNPKIFTGFASNSMFGADIAVGNLDEDIENELVISAYKASNSNGKEVGEIYIYDDLNFLKDNFNNYDLILMGESDYKWFGFNVDIANVNNDEIDDLIVGSFPYSISYENGSVNIYDGKNSLLDLNESQSFYGEDLGLIIGSDFLMADLDNNGLDDILINAININPSTEDDYGMIYAFLNGNSSNFDLKNADLKFYSSDNDEWFSYSMDTLDFNNDGYTDLAISARYADYNDLINAGKVYLIFGDKDGFGVQYDKLNTVVSDGKIKRGEFIKLIVDEFDLKEKHKKLIQNCYNFKEFCFYDFSGKSSFDGLTVDPNIILYPDVGINDDFYEEVNIATMLGIINGYMEADQSPFMPNVEVTRIQALKVILGASELVDYKYKFEMKDLLGSLEAILEQVSYYTDIDPKKSHMWWYPRYVNFAHDAGIISDNENFRPDDKITVEELRKMIDNTKSYMENL